MNNVVFMVGNIGSGKSTLAKKFANRGYVIMNPDSLKVSLNGGLYDLYDPKKMNIYHGTEDTIIHQAMKDGIPLVIDKTNMSREIRKRHLDIIKEYDESFVTCYDFGPGRLKRVKKIDPERGQTGEVWTGVWESMRDKYEKPSVEEGFDRVLTPPERYTVHAFDFDGYLARTCELVITEPIDENVSRLKELYANLENYVIIWTCRHGESLNEARMWLRKHNIPFDAINKNPLWETGSRKVFAHYYYDDRNAVENTGAE